MRADEAAIGRGEAILAEFDTAEVAELFDDIDIPDDRKASYKEAFINGGIDGGTLLEIAGPNARETSVLAGLVCGSALAGLDRAKILAFIKNKAKALGEAVPLAAEQLSQSGNVDVAVWRKQQLGEVDVTQRSWQSRQWALFAPDQLVGLNPIQKRALMQLLYSDKLPPKGRIWETIETLPEGALRLENDKLAASLASKSTLGGLKLSREEFERCGIKSGDLRHNHYIEVGGAYYKPGINVRPLDGFFDTRIGVDRRAWKTIWEACMGSGKSLVLELLPMIEVEKLSGDFAPFHLSSEHGLPHRKTLLLCSGTDNSSFDEMKNYLQRRYTAQVMVEGYKYKKKVPVDRWTDLGETKIRLLLQINFGISEQDLETFLDHVHFYNDGKQAGDRNKGDAELLRDETVMKQVQTYAATLARNGGDASQLGLTKQFAREVSRAWGLLNAWLVVGKPTAISTDIKHIKHLDLFSLLLIDEFDVATVSAAKDAVLAQPARLLQHRSMQICASGTLFRADKEHESFPEPLDRALAAELMNTTPPILKTLSIRPRFAVLADKDGIVYDQYSKPVTKGQLNASYLRMIEKQPSVVLDACLEETVMDFLKEEKLPYSIAFYVARGKGEGSTCKLMEDLCEQINDRNLICPVNGQPLTAEWVGDAKKGAGNQEVFARFKTGKTRIIVNYSLLVRGRDYPHLAAVVNMRRYSDSSVSILLQGGLFRGLRSLTVEGAKRLKHWRPEDIKTLEDRNARGEKLIGMYTCA